MRRIAQACLLALVLSACGGGGESAPPTNPPAAPPNPPPPAPPTTPPTTPPTPPPLTLVISATTISVQKTVLETGASETVELSLQNLPDTDTAPVYLSGFYSANGIRSASFQVLGSTVRVFVGFTNPFETVPRTYTDTIQLRACRESPCVTDIAGSPKTITINYTVVVPPNPPRVTLPANRIDVEGFSLDSTPPAMQTMDVTYANMGVHNSPTVRLSSTNSAVTSAGYNQLLLPAGPANRITIGLKAPAQLAPGLYTDVVTARFCLDSNCANELAGSPASITVRYNVSNSMPGPDGFTTRPVAADANDIVWDATRQVFYVSLASTSTNSPSSIAVLNPATATFTSYTTLGNNPGNMEISPDGQFLYVAMRGAGTVQRLLLPSLAQDLTIPMGTRPNGAQLYAKELHVAPGASHTIGVVRSTTAVSSGSEVDLAVYDDAVMRTQTFAGTSGKATTFQWDTASRIFAVDSSSTDGSAFQLAISAPGAQLTAGQPGVTAFDHRAFLLNERVIMQRGRVFDPLTFLQIGTLPLNTPFGVAMAIDAASGKAYVLKQGGIASYNLTTLAQVSAITLPNTAPTDGFSRLIRWGSDGLALMNHVNGAPSILLLNGSFVRP